MKNGKSIMLINLSHILGYEIQATDKPTGTVEDVYLDDILWSVRHVAIADAGGLGTQEASVEPKDLGILDAVTRRLHINLTHDQIAGGPDISSDLPVSKQTGERGDHHLRSIREIKGYDVVASDGAVGKLDDLIIGNDDWKIHFVVIETSIGGEHRKVLVGPGLIDHIKFDAKSVHLDLNSAHFADSPVYDPANPIEHSEDVKLVGRVGI